jgi:hypothetical protein
MSAIAARTEASTMDTQYCYPTAHQTARLAIKQIPLRAFRFQHPTGTAIKHGITQTETLKIQAVRVPLAQAPQALLQPVQQQH